MITLGKSAAKWGVRSMQGNRSRGSPSDSPVPYSRYPIDPSDKVGLNVSAAAKAAVAAVGGDEDVVANTLKPWVEEPPFLIDARPWIDQATARYGLRVAPLSLSEGSSPADLHTRRAPWVPF
jgi:hypothetical protein